jgi:hypothetical protein
METSKDRLVIHRTDDNDKDYFVKFPEHLVKSKRDEHQMLCTSMCSEAFAWMHDRIATLFSGKASLPRNEAQHTHAEHEQG